MPLLGCCHRTSAFKTLSRAAAKSAAAKLRSAGLLPVRVDWARRAEVCERCPLRIVRRGITYCGTPLTEQITRDPATDGCGCPIQAKAKSPHEHCPLTPAHQPATATTGHCDCKWCAAAVAMPLNAAGSTPRR